MRKKPELHIADKQALMVRVPAGQQCEICRRRPGPKKALRNRASTTGIQ